MIDPTEKDKLNRIFKDSDRRITRLEEDVEFLRQEIFRIENKLKMVDRA